MKPNRLQLMTKDDIPFPEGGLIITQPSIKDIGYIGEENFYRGCSFLTIPEKQDKNDLDKMTNFEILMTTMNTKKNLETQQIKIQTLMVLSLLFPNYRISYAKDKILFEDVENDKTGEINQKNFISFQEIVKTMFLFNDDSDGTNYKPIGPLGEKIAAQLEKRKKTLAKIKNGNIEKEINILSSQVSIIALGYHLDINTVIQYSVYQLDDQYMRLLAHENYESYVRSRLAGAKDIPEVEYWMKDLYDKSSKDKDQYKN